MSSKSNIDIFEDTFGFRPTQNQVKIRCPFHRDQNPSLSLNIHLGVFNCFACGEKGKFSKLDQLLTGGNDE